ncbi:hypothetical protein BGX24_004766, partial [Mortierella sp. AD032]
MKCSLLFLALVAAVQAAPLIAPAANPRVIPDSYIVVLKDQAAAHGFKTVFDGIIKTYSGHGRAPEIVREYSAIP